MKLSVSRGSFGGFTIVEAAIAASILATFLFGVYDMNWRAMSLMKAGRESTSAARLLQNRIEQIRTLSWASLTSGTYIATSVLSTTTASPDLPNLTETVDLNPYPLPSGHSQGAVISGTTLEIVRSANGTVTQPQTGTGSSLASQTAVRVDVTASWYTTLTGSNNSRQMSTVISNGGIYGRNQ